MNTTTLLHTCLFSNVPWMIDVILKVNADKLFKTDIYVAGFSLICHPQL